MKPILRSVLLAALALAAAGPLAAQDSTASVRTLLSSVSLGSPTQFGNLTLFPLSFNGKPAAAPFVTLDEALKRKLLEIVELDGGTVPEVGITNKSSEIVFIMGGEIITGGKQDRVVGSDVLIGPKASKIKVPVYCVEAGRWTYTTQAFTTKQNLGTWTIREKAQSKASDSQEGIWNDVGKIAAANATESSTSALQSTYDDAKVNRKIAELEEKLKNVPSFAAGTLGIACGVGGRIVSVDVFSNPALFAKLWPKILRAAALSSLTEEAGKPVTRDQAAVFMQKLADARFVQSAGIGAGADVKANVEGMTIGALGYKGAAVHVSAFPDSGD